MLPAREGACEAFHTSAQRLGAPQSCTGFYCLHFRLVELMGMVAHRQATAGMAQRWQPCRSQCPHVALMH